MTKSDRKIHTKREREDKGEKTYTDTKIQRKKTLINTNRIENRPKRLIKMTKTDKFTQREREREKTKDTNTNTNRMQDGN
jgi:hypothetical protein